MVLQQGHFRRLVGLGQSVKGQVGGHTWRTLCPCKKLHQDDAVTLLLAAGERREFEQFDLLTPCCNRLGLLVLAVLSQSLGKYFEDILRGKWRHLIVEKLLGLAQRSRGRQPQMACQSTPQPGSRPSRASTLGP